MTSELKPGDDAPLFILPSSDGKKVDLTAYRGKSHVILYFYPKDDTPGCTKEACAFRDSFAELKKAKAVILGVSLDPLASHQKFVEKYALPFLLLSDTDAAVSKAYGVYKLKNMYGRKFWGIERSTFLIDPKGKVTHLFRRVKVDAHLDEVLSALKELKRV
ncbi:MAG: thioredoxin-dependent thiol peroxidase [Candidatus Manganitrophus sp.]|nr:thioredoxin-dependent thiol peroxidase [Candidatus Manganitrophus sp.]MDC4224702.1 thioredoxin-dependent thiol peroxidase [Candidatus Manganitrophus sp.]WDT70297.1 MAG: thioredoxin-dependent thiol peroxidase [Candidatus Manganitrophus sp.]